MADSEYKKRQDGQTTVFTVTPASAPRSRFFLVIGIGLLPFAGMLAANAGVIGIAIALGLLAFPIWAYRRDPRPKDHKADRKFRVSASGIEVGGRTFSPGDIHRLIIRNCYTDNEIGATNAILAGQVATAPAAAVGTAVGQVLRAKMAKVSHSLELEAGGKARVLAGGMDETTAFGLMKDVSRIIGFS